MLAQQVSKTLPVLVGLSMVSAIAGAVLGTDPNAQTQCVAVLIGGANRTVDCTKWTGCKLSPPGQCEYGGKMVTPQSGNQAAEGDYELCGPAPSAGVECVTDDTESVCLSYQGYIQDTMCMAGPQCLVQIMKKDCHNSF